MPETKIEVDPSSEPDDQPVPLQNRWHPDIPAILSVDPDEEFRVGLKERFGGTRTAKAQRAVLTE